MNYLLVGRPNVGKSSIFNILIGKSINLIHKDEGTTRDWHKSQILLSDKNYIFDTPGLILNKKSQNQLKIKKTLKELVIKSDVLLFVIDFQSKLNSQDQLIINWLRTFNKKIVLLINKMDNFDKNISFDYFRFGISDVFSLSCSHKLGFDNFRKIFINNQLTSIHKDNNKNEFNYSIAIFGKPNAGKSTFLNTLLGYERSLTSVKAGTTSDYVTADLMYKSSKIRIFDTAGIARKSKIHNDSINYYAIQKINKVNAALMIIDSSQGLNRQDKRILNYISKHSQSLIIIFNKIDLIEKISKFKNEIKFEVETNFSEFKNIKIFYISSFMKNQIFKIFDYITNNILLSKIEFNTHMINKWLKICTNIQSHPMIEKKKVNFKYAVKVKDNPITIKIFCNYADKIKKNYKRYLINNFNIYFKIINQNTRIIFSKSENPYNK